MMREELKQPNLTRGRGREGIRGIEKKEFFCGVLRKYKDDKNDALSGGGTSDENTRNTAK